LSENDSPGSLSQARLDRISRPTAVYYRSYLKWWLRMSSDPTTYDSPSLVERAYRLGPEIARLKRTVQHPPPLMSSADWLVLEDELQRLSAQMRAIEETLEKREKASRWLAKRPAGSGCEAASASLEDLTPKADGWDPFRDM
jgi:hypothetical protein